MSTWEERMAAKHRAKVMRDVEAKRRAYLGEAFLRFYPPDDDEHLRWGFEPQVEILPEIIAANCLGITYGDPGPPLESNWCRQCWGDRHVWLGNCWGLQHVGGTMSGCEHGCHAGEVWMASASAPDAAPIDLPEAPRPPLSAAQSLIGAFSAACPLPPRRCHFHPLHGPDDQPRRLHVGAGPRSRETRHRRGGPGGRSRRPGDSGVTATISAVALLDLLLALPEPHPDLVASRRPTPVQVAEYAALLGWLPEPEDRFRPAVAG